MYVCMQFVCVCVCVCMYVCMCMYAIMNVFLCLYDLIIINPHYFYKYYTKLIILSQHNVWQSSVCTNNFLYISALFLKSTCYPYWLPPWTCYPYWLHSTRPTCFERSPLNKVTSINILPMSWTRAASHFEMSPLNDFASINRYTIHVCHSRHVPLREVAVEQRRLHEHAIHIYYAWHVPVRNVVIRPPSCIEHRMNVCHTRRVTTRRVTSQWTQCSRFTCPLPLHTCDTPAWLGLFVIV